MTEKTTDLIISKLLDASSIEHYAESCPIEEINKAMVSEIKNLGCSRFASEAAPSSFQ